jgi:hypothetical protein
MMMMMMRMRDDDVGGLERRVDYWYLCTKKVERVVRFGENGQKPAKGDCPAKLFSKVLPTSTDTRLAS